MRSLPLVYTGVLAGKQFVLFSVHLPLCAALRENKVIPSLSANEVSSNVTALPFSLR